MLVLSVVAILMPPVIASAGPPIQEITGVKPKPGLFKASGRDRPVVIRSSEDAAKYFPQAALAALSKKVDFTRQVVLAFAWRGSGRDKLTITIAESFPEQIFFKFRPGRTRDLRSHIHIYALRSNVTWRGPKGAGGGPYTKTKPVNKQPAAAGAAPPGGMQLLPGYTHKPLQGIDSIVGQIVKDDGWKISYEIGHVSKPGQPMIGGGFRDRPKLMPKAKVRWYREQTVNGRAVHMALTKDNKLLVSFPEKGMNFHATIRSFEQLADAMLMILTYSQTAPAGAKDKTAKSSSDAGKLAGAPTTITVDGKKLTLQVEGINNRMPTVGPRTSTGIYFIIRLKTIDRSAMPKGVTFDAVYGVQGKKKWATRKFDGPRGRISSMVEIVARNAPAWTVSSKIDVIVRLRDSAKKEHLIRAANVGTMVVH